MHRLVETNPASIINIAPVIIVNLFTTFVIATNPTFWLNDVTGGHPNIPVIELEKPSQASEPEISLSVISLSKPLQLLLMYLRLFQQPKP